VSLKMAKNGPSEPVAVPAPVVEIREVIRYVEKECTTCEGAKAELAAIQRYVAELEASKALI
jgi:hypothetical protein